MYVAVYHTLVNLLLDESQKPITWGSLFWSTCNILSKETMMQTPVSGRRVFLLRLGQFSSEPPSVHGLQRWCPTAWSNQETQGTTWYCPLSIYPFSIAPYPIEGHCEPIPEAQGTVHILQVGNRICCFSYPWSEKKIGKLETVHKFQTVCQACTSCNKVTSTSSAAPST